MTKITTFTGPDGPRVNAMLKTRACVATEAAIELTNEDHAEIDRLRALQKEDDDERVLIHAIYRAGITAGIARAENAALLLSANERIVALEAELFGQYKAPALSAGPLHTSVVPISTAPDCHRDEMP